MASSIETTSTTTTLKNNGNAYLSVDTNDDVAITNTLTATSPTFVTPNIGAATVTSLNGGQLAGNRNRIINGDMRIDQRNAGAAHTSTNANIYVLDRWSTYETGGTAGKFTVQQDAGAVTPPVGFSNYIGITSATAFSVTAGIIQSIRQSIEGFNASDLDWGTANAKTVTVSFWVRSSLTGTFGGVLSNGAIDYSYPFTYTISVSNTWEQKSVTIAGPTAGTWLTTNGAGLTLQFVIGTGTTYQGSAGSWSANGYYGATGAVNVTGTNGATLYITGVQLEEGTVATPFERRSYGTELALCQRYAWKYGGNISDEYLANVGFYADGNKIIFGYIQHPVRMRATPTLTVVGSPQVKQNGGATTGFTPVIAAPSALGGFIDMQKSSHGLTAGDTTVLNCGATSDYFLFVAEL
jgi:hypothetical protein